MKKWGADLTFKHLTGNVYDIYNYGQVIMCVKAFGRDAVVVDKHRTTLMTKQTTNVDRYDRGTWHTAEDGDIDNWWFEKSGPQESKCDGRMVGILEKIAQHHEQFIGKLITE